MTARRARIAAYWVMLVTAVAVFVVGDLYRRGGVGLACISSSSLPFCSTHMPRWEDWAVIAILGLIGWGVSRGGDRWVNIVVKAVRHVVRRGRRLRRGPHDGGATAPAERPPQRHP